MKFEFFYTDISMLYPSYFFYIIIFLQKTPINVILTEYVSATLEWNHLQEEVFKNCSMNGEIQFYNYRRNALVKTLKPSDEIISAAFKVKG